MKKNDVEKNSKAEKEIKKSQKVKEPKASSDAKVIFGIVAGMIIVCAALIAYYFWGVNNQVVATYKDGKVTRGEYEIYYKLFQPMLSYYGYSDDQIKEEVLSKVVIDKIVIEKANKDKLKLTKDEKKEIDEKFDEEDETSQYIEQGIDPEKMKQIYYDDAIISKYIEKLSEEATEETIKKFIEENEGKNATYGKYNTSYILYSTKGESVDKDEMKKNAEAALTRIKNGEDFAKVGEEAQSADTTNVQYGSDYAVFLNGTSVVAFEEAVRGLKVGTVTQELVNSKEYGYFIIKLNSIEENARVSGDGAKDNYVDELLAKWKKDAKVDAKDKRINKIAASNTTSTAK